MEETKQLIDDNPDSKQRKMKIIAYIIMILIQILISVSLVTAQLLGNAIPSFELNAFRCVGQIIIMVPVVIFQKTNLRVSKSDLIVYGVLSVLSTVFPLFLYAASVDTAVGTAICTTVGISLISNCVFSICSKSERTLTTYLGSFLALVGLILIIQPEFIFHHQYTYSVNLTAPCTNEVSVPPYPGYISILGFISLLAAGISLCSVTHLLIYVSKTSNIFCFLFWGGLVGFAFNIIMMLSLEKPVLNISGVCIFYFFLQTIAPAFNTIAGSLCLKYISPSIYLLINALSPSVLLALQHSVIKGIRQGHNNWVEVVGSCLCLLATFIFPILAIFKHFFNKLRT